MPVSNEPSIRDLREASERSREALATTVTELRERVGGTASELKTLVSPSHIKQEIKEYVRQEQDSIVGSLQRRAKENPLQAAAVGAALAFPALGLLRSLPAPLWLIGAGLFLTSRRGQQAAHDVKAKVNDAVDKGSERVSEAACSVQSDLQDRIAGARYGVEEARDSVSSAAGTMTQKALEAFHDARDAVVDAGADIGGKAKASAQGLGDQATGMARSVKESTAAAADRSTAMITDFVNQNPLLVAGIAATVGAFIAAAIPPSEAENKLFGAGSEKLKGKALETAAQGIEKAGDIAADAAGAMAAAAAREGLDASGVQDALGKVADSVRAVADRGLDTALGQSSENSATSSPPQHEPTTERTPS